MQTATPPHVISRVVSDSQRGLAVTNLVWAKHPGQNCSGLLAAEIKVSSPLRLNAHNEKTGSLKNASCPTIIAVWAAANVVFGRGEASRSYKLGSIYDANHGCFARTPECSWQPSYRDLKIQFMTRNRTFSFIRM